MSAKDPYSYIKIFRHKDKLDAIRRGEVTAPIYVRIKPTNACNHHCYYCSYGNPGAVRQHVSELRAKFHPNDQIEWEIMAGLIKDLGELNVCAVTFSGGGEPLLYPHIAEAMRLVLEYGMDLSVITNGSLLNEDRAEILKEAKWVRISMDSSRPERYGEIRKVKRDMFHKIANNIQEFSRIKNPGCELGINFVITPQNADEVYEMAVFAKDIGVNHIKMCAVIDPDMESVHGPIKDKVIAGIERARGLQDEHFKVISKYADDLALNAIFERSYGRCAIQQIIPVVAADAKVYMCHDKAYVPGGELGSLKEKTFRDIWFSEETKQRFHDFDARQECRHHCVYDQRNIFINQYLDLDESQINFI